MSLHELAEEFALTDVAAAALCTRLGIAVSSADDVVSEADATRFRAAAHADLAGDAPPLGPLTPDDVSAGWAAPGPSTTWPPFGTGTPGGTTPSAGPAAGFAPGPAGPTGHPGGTGQPSWAPGPDRARIEAARVQARAYTNQGYALLVAGLVITIGTMALAPGGFFIVSFGLVFTGFRRLRAGRMLQARIREAEAQLGPD
jgi:hypothetical protein